MKSGINLCLGVSISVSVSSTNLFKKAVNLEISPQFDAYTGVRILTGIQDEDGNDIVYFAGNENGRVLEVTNEWGTQTQAEHILANIQNRSYKPYTASSAIIDPAAELNDGVTVNGVYSGICSKVTRFGTLMDSDIAAPQDQEIDHEYTFETPQDRKYTRQVKEFRSELKIQASQIAAKVSSSGGASSSFGWVLTDSDWTLYSNSDPIFKVNRERLEFRSNGSQVLECDSSGLRVNGLIEAREFRTSAGQTLATSDQLDAIRTSSVASWGQGNSGFVGALNNGINFANMAQNGTSGTYTANWVVANHIYCYMDEDKQTITGLHYGRWLDESQEYHPVSWLSVNVPYKASASIDYGYVSARAPSGTGSVSIPYAEDVSVSLTSNSIKYLGT